MKLLALVFAVALSSTVAFAAVSSPAPVGQIAAPTASASPAPRRASLFPDLVALQRLWMLFRPSLHVDVAGAVRRKRFPIRRF